MKRTLVAGSVALLAVLGARAAFAAPSPEDVERARTFFNAGAQAYAATRWSDAVRSFEQSYALAPRPPILFSLAQAERKAFLEYGEPRYVKKAIEHYKEYLEQVPTGGRRAEALEAKADLEARLAKLDPHQATAEAPQEKRKPRVTVYSPTAGARASLDGGPPEELPFFADLEPGKHRVRVFADGYFDAEQEVSGDKGLDVPVNLPLSEKPALVTVEYGSSAEIYVDGRLAATAPVSRPIEVPPGVHVISVIKNGKKPYSAEVTLARNKPFKLTPKLETSGQRTLAYSMLGTGGASLALGGLFALGAAGQERDAREIESARAERNLSPEELERHNRLIDQRDANRTAAIVLTSVGGAALVGGALFYFFDKPQVAVLPPRSVEPGPSPRRPDTPLDVTAKLRPFPIVGAGVYGAGLGAQF